MKRDFLEHKNTKKKYLYISFLFGNKSTRVMKNTLR